MTQLQGTNKKWCLFNISCLLFMFSFSGQGPFSIFGTNIRRLLSFLVTEIQTVSGVRPNYPLLTPTVTHKHRYAPNQTQPPCTAVPASQQSKLRAFMCCGFCGPRLMHTAQGSWKVQTTEGFTHTHWLHHAAPHWCPQKTPATHTDQMLVSKNYTLAP